MKGQEERIKELKERANKVSEIMLKYVHIDKLEALAKKVENPSFRKGVAFKAFINSL